MFKDNFNLWKGLWLEKKMEIEKAKQNARWKKVKSKEKKTGN